MNAAYHGSTKSYRVARTCLALLVLAALVTGCQKDRRISVSEYLEMQESMEQAAAPRGEQAIAQASARIDEALGPDRVGPGDVLAVTLYSRAQAGSAPVLVRVDEDGRIFMPLTDETPIEVGGKTIGQAEKAIRDAHVPEIYPQVVVHAEWVEQNATRVIVRGQVSAPGLVALPATTPNLVTAISLAGGFTPLASGEVTLSRVRNPADTVTVDVTDPEQTEAIVAMPPLASGDIITVHAAGPSQVYVTGLVNAPVPQAIAAGAKITVLQALSGAAGLRTDVTPTEATLVRRLPDGQDVHVKLDLMKIKSGDDPNIELAVGDVLHVPHTPLTRIQQFINQNVSLRAGASANYSVIAREEFADAKQSQTTTLVP